MSRRRSVRLSPQQHRVHSVMHDGEFRTLSEIAAITGDKPASIGAALRALRRKGLTVLVSPPNNRAGTHEYAVIP